MMIFECEAGRNEIIETVLSETEGVELLATIWAVLAVPVEGKLGVSFWSVGFYQYSFQVIVIKFQGVREKGLRVFTFCQMSRENARISADIPSSQIRVESIIHGDFPEKSRVFQPPVAFRTVRYRGRMTPEFFHQVNAYHEFVLHVAVLLDLQAEYGSVVDDAMVQPFVRFGFEKFCGWQDLSATLSWYQTFQQDRRQADGQNNPGGAELTVSLRNWNVGIENRLYYGKDLMPFYNYVDDGGFKYGNDLYGGSPFYRIVPVNAAGYHFYDRAEVYWQPHIADFLDLRLSIVAHFPDGFKYAGMQQKLSLIFSLDKLLNPTRSPASSASRKRRNRKGCELPGPFFGI